MSVKNFEARVTMFTCEDLVPFNNNANKSCTCILFSMISVLQSPGIYVSIHVYLITTIRKYKRKKSTRNSANKQNAKNSIV